jgi:hypothetical protein
MATRSLGAGQVHLVAHGAGEIRPRHAPVRSAPLSQAPVASVPASAMWVAALWH